ncbi:MAG TPA: HEAT repeat domain-containing protein [Polyangiales bacterium]
MRSPEFDSSTPGRSAARGRPLWFAALLLLGAAPAAAQAGETASGAKPAGSVTKASAAGAAKGKSKPAGPLDELSALLASQDSDELRLGIESAASSRRPGSAVLLAERVRAGLPADLIGPAIDALAALGDPKAGDVLAELSAHRRPAVRVRALLALSILRAPNAEGLLIRALSDQDESVRKAGVEGLGEIGSKQALAPLFRALERGVEGAAAALGKLAEASTVPRVTAQFGRISFVSLAPLLDALLMRRGFSEEAKLSIVDAATRQATAEARAYLEGLAPQLPADTPLRVRKAVTDALLRMPK